MVVHLACFVQAPKEDVAVFASNLTSSIPVQNLSKFFEMFIKVFKVANTSRNMEIRKGKYTICIVAQ